MADNTQLSQAVGLGDVVASDEIALSDATTIKIPRVKLTPGSDGAMEPDASSLNPFPMLDLRAVALLEEMLAELRAMRLALVMLATDGGRAVANDFEP
jgi:hypothetical protein